MNSGVWGGRMFMCRNKVESRMSSKKMNIQLDDILKK